MKVDRVGAASVNFKQQIYVFGGEAKPKSVEMLDLKDPNADWKEITSMNIERKFAAAAVWNGLLF